MARPKVPIEIQKARKAKYDKARRARQRRTSHPLRRTKGEWDAEKVKNYAIRQAQSGLMSIDSIFRGHYVNEAGEETKYKLPTSRTYYYLMARHPEWQQEMKALNIFRSHVMVEKLIGIVEADEDEVSTEVDGRLVTDHGKIQMRRLKADVLFKGMAILNPKEYNLKTQVEHSGGVDVKTIMAAVQGDGVEDLEAIKAGESEYKDGDE